MLLGEQSALEQWAALLIVYLDTCINRHGRPVVAGPGHAVGAGREAGEANSVSKWPRCEPSEKHVLGRDVSMGIPSFSCTSVESVTKPYRTYKEEGRVVQHRRTDALWM